jgi:hypothetical protein
LPRLPEQKVEGRAAPKRRSFPAPPAQSVVPLPEHNV